MGSERRMRCSMSVSKPKTSSLATEEAVRYSSAYGEQNQCGASSSDAVCGLCRSGERLRRDDHAGVAQVRHRGHAVYAVGARGQDGLRGGVFQWLGQGGYAHEASGGHGGLGRRSRTPARRAHVHVRG